MAQVESYLPRPVILTSPSITDAVDVNIICPRHTPDNILYRRATVHRFTQPFRFCMVPWFLKDGFLECLASQHRRKMGFIIKIHQPSIRTSCLNVTLITTLRLATLK